MLITFSSYWALLIRIEHSDICLKFWSKGPFELAEEPESEPKEKIETVSAFTDWLRFTEVGIKLFENINLKEQRVATTRQGIMSLLEMKSFWRDRRGLCLFKDYSLISQVIFRNSYIATCFGWIMGNDDPDGTTLVEDRSVFSKNCHLMSFNICCQFVLLRNIYFFLAKIYHLDPTLTLILWENLSVLMSSPLASAGFEPPVT
jgi:hypothetical protein